MKVLVIGSIRGVDSEDKRNRFITACRELGNALARAGWELAVGSDDPETADKYVVEGALSVSGIRKIWVFRPRGGHTPFDKERAEHARQVEFIYEVIEGPWAAVHVPQVIAADAVVLIGGGPATAQVGYVAPALERPVLAIPCFGGAADDLWQSFKPFYERLSSPLKEKLGNLQVDWQSSNADLAIQILQVASQRRLFQRETKVSQSVALFLISLFLFTVWVWLFVSPFEPRGIAFFALLGVSAFLGTGLRTTLNLLTDPTIRLWPSRVTTELTTGLLLAFGLAVVFLIGGFTITGKFEFISSTAQLDNFQRIALAMSALGFAGGWLIERVSESLRQWLSERLPRQDDQNGAA